LNCHNMSDQHVSMLLLQMSYLTKDNTKEVVKQEPDFCCICSGRVG
jgi:hypothetical protein